MEISKDNIAQWVIDNRYPKSEFEKISDMEMYHEIVAMIEKLINKNSVIPDVVKPLQDKFCTVCNLPTDGEKCYSGRCPM